MNKMNMNIIAKIKNIVPNQPKLNIGWIFPWLKKLPVVSLILIAPLIIFGIFGPFLFIHDPHAIDLSQAFLPPTWIEGGSSSYFLGTDQLGRDLLTRMMEGARYSLIVAIFGVFISGAIGVTLGMISGFLGGWIDNLIMRLVDTWMAIPGIFLMLILIALMQQIEIQGLIPIIVALGLTSWVPYCQMIRGETLSLKERDFIQLAKATGCSHPRILRKHLFPNVMNTSVIIATQMIGGVIMMEAGVSFLGLGIQPPYTAWGSLIAESNTYISSAWWIPTFAGLAITMTILGFNLFGDWLRDVLDPRTRQAVR